MNSDKDIYYMREALKLAHDAYNSNEVPVGAILVLNDRIISKSGNMVETLKDSTAHAEMIAITSALSAYDSKTMLGATLYVTLEPCPMCASAMNHSNIRRLVYGAEDLKGGFSKYTPSLLHPKCQVISGIMKEECSEIIIDFFKKLRK
jgi:tRNA(adenine34) deaminase